MCACVRAGFQERFHLRPCAGGGVDGDVPAHLVKLSFDLSREFLRARSPKIDVSLKSHIWTEVLGNFQSG